MDNPLIASVQCLPPAAKISIFNAATAESFKRRTWRGCPLNRAGCQVHAIVVSERNAMHVFGTSRRVVRKFLLAWDYLPGTDAECTSLLLESIITVGLFSEPLKRRQHRHRTPAAAPRTAVAGVALALAPPTAIAVESEDRELVGV